MTPMQPPTSLQEDTDRKVAALVRQLRSWRRKKREEAERALQQIEPGEFNALLHLFWREARKEYARDRYIRLMVGLPGLLLFGLSGIFLRLVPSTSLPFVILVGLIGSVAYCLHLGGLFSRGFKRAVRALALCDNVLVVESLLWAAQSDSGRVYNMAREALIRLFPRLRTGGSGVWNESLQTALCQVLKIAADRYGDDDLSVEILTTLEQKGDSLALPNVRKRAESRAWTSKHRRIRAAAQRCLPAIQERAEQERVRQTLLRPASAPDGPADVLLRPAQGVSEADPQTLLRPAMPERQQKM